MRLLFLLAISPTAASAATLSVGPGLTYTTISEALDAAADGDRIEVAGGVYQEVLEIDIDVEIVGDSNQPVELGSANSVPTLIDIDDAVVHLENLQIELQRTLKFVPKRDDDRNVIFGADWVLSEHGGDDDDD